LRPKEKNGCDRDIKEKEDETSCSVELAKERRSDFCKHLVLELKHIKTLGRDKVGG